ncbi:hypothetical protein I6U48_24855 [Clostridium sp. PL3]|uniref:Uncharacterized protein n=1 Tax=Clostridium thailandense TaxID=2794346 RepID=A0A949TPF0_9CLOT|nr:hypothetical protein [Clostridium thailandense]MBV7276120.1 hypothetical protein [Clostridium thailandense]
MIKSVIIIITVVICGLVAYKFLMKKENEPMITTQAGENANKFNKEELENLINALEAVKNVKDDIS